MKTTWTRLPKSGRMRGAFLPQATGVALLALCGLQCSTDPSSFFDIEQLPSSQPAVPSPDLPPEGTVLSHVFDLVTLGLDGKLDILFVIDNSGSIAGNGDGVSEEERLQNNFQNFANNYLSSGLLDLCITIITTDYYLGNRNPRDVPCTGEASNQQIVNSFIQQIAVGTNGNSSERPLQSVIEFLQDRPVNSSNPAFRADAKYAVVIATDEAEQSSTISNFSFRNIMNNYFNALHGATSAQWPWFVTAINHPVDSANICLGPQPPGGCMPGKLNAMTVLQPNSFIRNIQGGNNEYTNILDNLGLSASPQTRTSFPLVFPPGPNVSLTVSLLRANGQITVLQAGTHFAIEQGGLQLVITQAATIQSIVAGDRLEIKTNILQ